MVVKLQALGLKNYRGIGPEWQFMPRLRKFNFFIGANNAGKSAVLNFLSAQLAGGLNKISPEKLSPLERYDGGSKGPVGYAFGVPDTDGVANALAKISNERSRAANKAFVQRIVEALAPHGTLWLGAEIGGQPGLKPVDGPTIEELERLGGQDEWYRLWNGLTGSSAGSLTQHWIPESMSVIQSAQHITVPKINLIPAKRQIGPKSEGFEDYSGRGLIDRLAETQSPDWNKREDREIFDRINDFVGQVTGDAGARIEIPHNREQILVHMAGRVLPLTSLGTGIHEVILIAAFCTISIDQIVCIEEPEIHLHPLMQRRLIEYLDRQTNNQYFIATHSPALIDTQGSAIFHVSHGGDQVRIRETILAADRYEICADLGCRASDIVQSNAVIWVEGPSDRIYINHWIHAIDKNLIEGIHYSVMFYGGRLLSHLGAESDEIGDFISLRSLNRNSAIVMDSDRDRPSAKINSTKKRIVSSFSGPREVVWVTAGREIENYVNPDLLHKCLSSIYADIYAGPAGVGRYDHALHFARSSPTRKGARSARVKDESLIEKSVDKVRLARAVTSEDADLRVLDLKTRVGELVEMIRHANAY